MLPTDKVEPWTHHIQYVNGLSILYVECLLILYHNKRFCSLASPRRQAYFSRHPGTCRAQGSCAGRACGAVQQPVGRLVQERIRYKKCQILYIFFYVGIYYVHIPFYISRDASSDTTPLTTAYMSIEHNYLVFVRKFNVIE